MQNSKSEAPVIFSKEGFTIIEILVVVVIIGILASIVVVSFNTTLRHSREGKRIADLKNVSTALDMYYAENNSYPNSYEVSVFGMAFIPAGEIQLPIGFPGWYRPISRENCRVIRATTPTAVNNISTGPTARPINCLLINPKIAPGPSANIQVWQIL